MLQGFLFITTEGDRMQEDVVYLFPVFSGTLVLPDTLDILLYFQAKDTNQIGAQGASRVIGEGRGGKLTYGLVGYWKMSTSPLRLEYLEGFLQRHGMGRLTF